jgi:putative NADH-flavin reductase
MQDKNFSIAIIGGSGRVGLEWTIIRSRLIEEGPALGGILVDLKDAPGASIRAADLALFLLEEAEAGRHIGEAPFVGQHR